VTGGDDDTGTNVEKYNVETGGSILNFNSGRSQKILILIYIARECMFV
jgi:hypothetical protein